MCFSFFGYAAKAAGYLVIALLSSSLVGYASQNLRFYARVLTFTLGIIFSASCGVVSSSFFYLIGRKSISQWFVARLFYGTASPLTGIEFKIENEHILWSSRPAVFISNHQTEIDILMLGRSFPMHCSVTSKKSLKYMPFLGWFMSLSGTVFIDRGNRENAIKRFDSAVQTMKTERQSVWIFPEGTRSYDKAPNLLPFKKGAFHIAVKAGVPIIPIVVQNYAHLMNFKDRRFEAGTVKIKVLDPIETSDKTLSDVDDLCIQARTSMIETLQALHTSSNVN